MRVEGDDGGVLDFSRLRDRRARARLDRRGARAARGARSARACGRRRRPCAAHVRVADGRPGRGDVRFDDGGIAVRAARRRRRRPALAGARSGRHRRRAEPYGQTAVVANFACERAHHGRAYQWFRDDGGILAWLPLPGRRVSIVWSAPEALAQELLALEPAALAARVADARRGSARRASNASRRRRISAAVPEAAGGRRASPGAGRRCRARRPSAGGAGREPGLRRRRGAGGGPARARAGDRCRARRCCSSATRAGAPDPCARCRPSPTGSRIFSGDARRGSGRHATSAWPPSSGCRPPGACWRSLRCARPLLTHSENPMSSIDHDALPPAGAPRSSRRRRAARRSRAGADAGRAAPAHGRGGAGEEAARAEVPGRRGRRASPRARTSASTRCSSTTSSSTPSQGHLRDGRHVYDAATKKNLTEAHLRELNRVAFDSLPLDLAFKRVKGNGERKLAIFSDADCPFCARLEKELKGVDNVTIYTFLFPIDQLHPDAARKSRMIWCSPDKVKAWDEFFASGELPDNKGDCDNPRRRDRRARAEAAGQGDADAGVRRRLGRARRAAGAAARGRDQAGRSRGRAARRGEEVTRPRAAALTAPEGASSRWRSSIS